MPAIDERNSFTTDEEARSIIGTRVYDAPRELVFDVWTNEHHVNNWWGPRGFTTTTHVMDVRPGGEWRFIMHGPDGTDYDNEIVYLEVVRPERLVYTHGPQPIFDVTVTFTEEAGGKTRVTLRSTFASAEIRNQIEEAVGATEGMHQHLDRLGEYVAARGEFQIARRFAAPRDLVFRVWTECDHLQHWWGPKGVKVFSCKNDLRPGGTLHYAMRTPDGTEMWGRWLYREIASPERLVFISSFSDPQGNVTRPPFSDDWPVHLLTTITFEAEDGFTVVKVRWTPYEATEREIATFEANFASMDGGWSGTFDELASYLATKKG